MTEVPDEVPEADWVEQVVDADPATGQQGAAGERLPRAEVRGEANEADLSEQDTIAYVEDDEAR